MPISFFFPEKKITLKNRTKLKSFIETIFIKERTQLGALNYIFCSDKTLLSMNRQYLAHDYYTDILTFDLTPPGSKTKQAEIYISIDRVKDNAQNAETSFKEEIHRVIFHGILHLCGYTDKTKAEQMKMRETEDKYLKIYKV